MSLTSWLTGLLLLLSVSAQGQSAKLLFSVDLSKFGYAEPPSPRYEMAYSFLQPLAFLNGKVLAVSFFAQNPKPGLTQRDGTAGGQLLFHSVFLDLSRRVLGERSWGNAGYWNALIPLWDHRFLVQAGDFAAVYSNSLDKIVERKLSYNGDMLPRFEGSPTGKTLFCFQDWWDTGRKKWVTRNQVIDPASLAAESDVIGDGHQYESVTDQHILFSASPAGTTPLLRITPVKDLKREVKLLQDPSRTRNLIAKLKCGSATLVNDSTVAITGGCSDLVMVPSNGLVPDVEPVLVSYSGYIVGSDLQVSGDGKRLAFLISKTRKKSKQVSSVELVVYDLAKQRSVFRSELAPLPQHKIGFALLSDGNLLAIENDRLVQLWSLSGSA